MTFLARHAARVTAMVAGAVLAVVIAVGCAKESTSLFVGVDADPSVPPILILRTTVARVDDPSVQSSASRASPYASDAADRPGPWLFPVGLPLTVDPVFAGDVTVTVDGIDWDTSAVIASGDTSATIAAQKQTTASLTLEPIRTAGSDGGTD
jgi:hypothetical protein